MAVILFYCFRRRTRIYSLFIIEDNSDLQSIYKYFFGKAGFSIIGQAFDGLEAIEMFSSFERKPDFILLDYRMPLRDGIEVTKEILLMDKNARIIFASADSSIKDVVLKLGAICFIEKPFDISRLIIKIKKNIHKSTFS
ncbi:MAG: response regulator [Candidatus Helarchaeota archaeon]